MHHLRVLIWCHAVEDSCPRAWLPAQAGMQIMQEEEYRQAALAVPRPQQGAPPEQALIARIMSGVQTAMRVRAKPGRWLPVWVPISSWVLPAHQRLLLTCPSSINVPTFVATHKMLCCRLKCMAVS